MPSGRAPPGQRLPFEPGVPIDAARQVELGAAQLRGVFDAVRVGYAESGREWLQRVVDRLRPCLDEGIGLLGWTFEPSGDELTLGTVVSSGAPEGGEEAVIRINRGGEPAALSTAYGSAELAVTTSSLFARSFGCFPAEWDAVTPPGVADVLALKWVTPAGGMTVAAPLSHHTRLTAGARRTLERVTVHLAAAWRLRVNEGRRAQEAVLHPDGRLAHAERDARTRQARDSLRDAVLAAERARLRSTGDEEALELWRGLVDGRWSLVDRFDRDGRRYYVAVENPPLAHPVVALSPRQRSIAELAARGLPNKIIAYALGLSAGTVAGGLSEALQKLGLSSRVELTSVVHAAARGGPPADEAATEA